MGAKNYLYTMHLVDVAHVKESLEKIDLDTLQGDIRDKRAKLARLKKNLKRVETKLKKQSDTTIKKALQSRKKKLKKRHVSSYQTYQKSIESYTNTIDKHCILKNKLQKAMIEANLFSDTYQNSNALYNSQQQEQAPIGRHKALCMMLTQIGLRLQKSKYYLDKAQSITDLKQKALCIGEMLNHCALYEANIASMLSNNSDNDITDTSLSFPSKSLKQKISKKAFNPNFRRLLERSSSLVKSLKENPGMTLAQRAKEGFLKAFRFYLIGLGQAHERTPDKQLTSIFERNKEGQEFINTLNSKEPLLLLEAAKDAIFTTFREKLRSPKKYIENDKALLWGYTLKARQSTSKEHIHSVSSKMAHS